MVPSVTYVELNFGLVSVHLCCKMCCQPNVAFFQQNWSLYTYCLFAGPPKQPCCGMSEGGSSLGLSQLNNPPDYSAALTNRWARSRRFCGLNKPF